jgi:V/A-type H+-transporting ATPase subunit E
MIKKQELASAELNNKKVLLEAKKQIIDRVFSEATKKVEGLDDKKREDYINKLLEKAKSDIGVENIYCNEKDIKILKDFNVKGAGLIGGLIAENKEKTIRIDYSFDTMIQNIKENELQGINKILFG